MPKFNLSDWPCGAPIPISGDEDRDRQARRTTVAAAWAALRLARRGTWLRPGDGPPTAPAAASR